MRRNLDSRVEVAVPVLSTKLQTELLDQFKLQWADGIKARRINKGQTNPYRTLKNATMGSQEGLYKRIKAQN